MFLLSRRVFLLAAVVATATLVSPVAATTDTMADVTTTTASDQVTEPYTSDPIDATATDDTMDATDAEEESDEPVDSDLDCEVDLSSDGQCDESNNSASCGYDGGDCCECTCAPGNFNCGGKYNCIDPDAVCVEDDDGGGGVMTTMDLGTDDAGTDDGVEDAAETGADDTDSATGSRPWSSVSAGITAAAGAAVILAGWGL